MAAAEARGDPISWPAVAGVVAALLVGSLAAASSAFADAPGAGSTPGYVGGARCAGCHPKESEAWRGARHPLAMPEATPRTVLGSFADARLRYGAVTSHFFRRGGRFWVRTDGADGRLADFEIRHTFGVAPLQQYLIALPDGRLQALGIAWDARPRTAGGQRWFHLHPDEKVDSGDVLHWTGAAQNWNHQCAECHSTGVRKNYRPDTSHFATTWTDIAVACEACHGPGARHVTWAAGDRTGADATKELDASLSPGAGSFAFAAGTGIARLVGARDTGAQIAACGRCHARRAEISEDWRPGRPLTDTHVVSLLDEELYEADGQMRDEVYEYGSFLQSRMHAQRVACSDCHDPHAGGVRAEGNAVCTTCHAPATYDVASHHHHRERTEATRCIACHMPSRLYMVIDRRHDHGFRVPRPDLSVELGTPNACTDCHRDRPPAWAAAAVTTWHGPTRTRGPSWAGALAAGRRRETSAAALLADVIGQAAVPGIVRATALELSSRSPGRLHATLVTRALGDADPLVRRAALGGLLAVEPGARAELAAPFLVDPVRTVRLEAVSVLAQGTVPAASRQDFERTVEEFRAAQALNADRADAWLNLGVLDSRLGNAGPAEAAYRRAIRLQPDFMPAYVNLADLYRTQGRDPEGERLLRQALRRQPDAAAVHHGLGLLLVRAKRREEAVAELARAAKLAPNEPRYAYAHALALDGIGKRREAMAVLADAQHRFPGDREILEALVQLSAEMKDREAAER